LVVASLSLSVLPERSLVHYSFPSLPPLTLHQPSWLAPLLLRTNHCPYLSLYK
jgi:hypothetical protein